MDTSTSGRGRFAVPRRIAFRVVAALVALLTGGFGVALYVGAGSPERMVHRLHDIGPALVFILVFAVAAAALVMTGAHSVAPMQQMIAGAVALLVAGAAGGRLDAAAVVLAVLIVVLMALHPERTALFRVRQRPSRLLAGLAIAGAVPLTWFAVGQVALQRSAVMFDAHGTEAHYAGMAATALSFATVALVASLRAEGWRVTGWVAGLGVGLYGVATLATPRLPGSFGSVGAVTAIIGGLAFLAAVEAEARTSQPQSVPGETRGVRSPQKS